MNPVYASCNVHGRYQKRDTQRKPSEERPLVLKMCEILVSGNLFQAMLIGPRLNRL